MSYRWFRDGELVKGVTGPEYELTGADVGSRITVIADGHSEGSDGVATAASDPSDTIKRESIEQLEDPR